MSFLPRRPASSERGLARRTGPAAVLATILVAGLAGGPVATASPARFATAASATEAVAAAVDYVAGQLVDGDHVEADGFVQHGQTLDVAFGLSAAGDADETLDAVTAYMTTDEAVGAYTQGVPNDMDDAAYVGGTGKLGLAATLWGMDPTDLAGRDLVAQLQSLEQDSGRFSDRSEFGDFSTVLSQSFAVLFLTAAEGVEPSAESEQFLVEAQCDDGGFPVDFAATAADCAASPDATGLALQALLAVDARDDSAELSPEHLDAARAALAWLEDTRDADGSWQAFDAPNVNATAYAAMGQLAAGAAADPSIAWLAGLQLPDGGLPLTPDAAESDLFATAQALAPLASASLLSLDESVLTAAAITAAEPTAPESPATTAPATTAPATTPAPTAATTDAATSAPAISESSDGGVSTVVLVVVLVALGLLLAGVAVVVAARRRTASRPGE